MNEEITEDRNYGKVPERARQPRVDKPDYSLPYYSCDNQQCVYVNQDTNYTECQGCKRPTIPARPQGASS